MERRKNDQNRKERKRMGKQRVRERKVLISKDKMLAQLPKEPINRVDSKFNQIRRKGDVASDATLIQRLLKQCFYN